MRIWGVLKPEQVEELVRVGAFLRGKVISVDGDRVTLDFGDFVGEGLWEATQPLPREGDVVVVRIKDPGPPVVLGFVKRIKANVPEPKLERMPEVELPGLDEGAKREFALFMKVASKAAHLSHLHTLSRPHADVPVVVAFPLVAGERRGVVYFTVDEEDTGEEGEVYTIRLLVDEEELGRVRVDVVYFPSRGKRLVVSIQAQEKKTKEALDAAKEVLAASLKKHGFFPSVGVFYNPRISSASLLGRSGVLERRA